MGRHSDLMIQLQEDAYNDQKAEWIRRELNDPDANESSDGWDELEEQYDFAFTNWEDHLAGEYEWFNSQEYSNFRISFVQTINDIKRVLYSSIEPTVVNTTYKMLYVHSVTAMETYLGDTLKSLVMNKKEFIYNAAKNLYEFKKEKFQLQELILNDNFLEKTVLNQLNKYLYHDVGKVMMIYKSVLGFNGSYDLKNLSKITSNRHDLVHRNGKDNSGKGISLDLSLVQSAIKEIESFIEYIDENLTAQLQDNQ